MKITRVYVQRRSEPQEVRLRETLVKRGYPVTECRIERVYRLAGDPVDERLLQLLVNPVYETWSSESRLDPAAGPIVEVSYKRAVIDPESNSILEGAKAVSFAGLVWARLSYRYQLLGVTSEEADRIAEEELMNPIVQEMVAKEWEKLLPGGKSDPVRWIDLSGCSDEELVRISEENSWFAPLEQMKVLQAYQEELGRPFSDAEIEIVVQSWSDHCYHTTWKALGLMKELKRATKTIDHPLMVSVFTDNAGGMEFYDGWVVTIKGETHNYPSSISPYGGVATKHGGVIRDTIGFGKGAYPIGGSTVMGTLDPRTPADELPSGALAPRFILKEAIRATADYCNPMGIPLMYAAYRQHPGYPKCLALGHSLGLVPREYAHKDKVQPGDLVVVLGGRTGRDGLHGATSSSATMSGEDSEKESAAVQIGDPLIEAKFMQAIPQLRDADCIRAITDLGAGGISCGAGEMGAETGVMLDLDKVPVKYPGLTAWEILLSESQERMLLAIPRDKLAQAEKILEQYDVEMGVIGEFTATKRFQATWQGELVVDIGMDFLWGRCPIVPMNIAEPQPKALVAEVDAPRNLRELAPALKAVLAHYHCCDQSAAIFQFDTTAQGRTVQGPLGGITGKMPTDAFVAAPLWGKPYGVVSTLAYNPFYGDVDPVGLARLMMIEAISKAVVVGADPDAIALCDNFYTPRCDAEVGWNLKGMVSAIAALSVKLGTPFISGKDSSSGTFVSKDGQVIDVPYTFAVATLGRMPDVGKLVTKEFKRPGSQILLVGYLDPDKLGGSVYLDCYGCRGNELADLTDGRILELKQLWRKLYGLYQSEQNPILAAGTIGEGGLFVKLFEMCYGAGLGAELDLGALPEGRLDGKLFSEAVGAILVELPLEVDPASVFGSFPWQVIGRTLEQPVIRLQSGAEELALPMAELVSVWESTFKEMIL